MPKLQPVDSRLLSSRRQAEISTAYRMTYDPNYDATKDTELADDSDRDSGDSDDNTEDEEDGVAVLLTALRRAETARSARVRQSYHLQRLLSTADALIGVRRAWVNEDSAATDVALQRAKNTCVLRCCCCCV